MGLASMLASSVKQQVQQNATTFASSTATKAQQRRVYFENLTLSELCDCIQQCETEVQLNYVISQLSEQQLVALQDFNKKASFDVMDAMMSDAETGDELEIEEDDSADFTVEEEEATDDASALVTTSYDEEEEEDTSLFCVPADIADDENDEEPVFVIDDDDDDDDDVDLSSEASNISGTVPLDESEVDFNTFDGIAQGLAEDTLYCVPVEPTEEVFAIGAPLITDDPVEVDTDPVEVDTDPVEVVDDAAEQEDFFAGFANVVSNTEEGTSNEDDDFFDIPDFGANIEQDTMDEVVEATITPSVAVTVDEAADEYDTADAATITAVPIEDPEAVEAARIRAQLLASQDEVAKLKAELEAAQQALSAGSALADTMAASTTSIMNKMMQITSLQEDIQVKQRPEGAVKIKTRPTEAVVQTPHSTQKPKKTITQGIQGIDLDTLDAEVAAAEGNSAPHVEIAEARRNRRELQRTAKPSAGTMQLEVASVEGEVYEAGWNLETYFIKNKGNKEAFRKDVILRHFSQSMIDKAEMAGRAYWHRGYLKR